AQYPGRDRGCRRRGPDDGKHRAPVAQLAHRPSRPARARPGAWRAAPGAAPRRGAPPMMDSWWLFALNGLGLGAITLITRAFFMYPEREVPMPHWLKRGLKYAPLAALAAVIAPELVITQGVLINTLM